jgi:pimeloyl-ACP methyl ester carboxylesterase
MTRYVLWFIVLAAPATSLADEPKHKDNKPSGKYAEVNGLKLYYEDRGEGEPLVLLHGSFGWGTSYPELAKGRRVITPDFQGHGRTADIDRPLSFEQLADDVAALLKSIRVERADVFGYSTGGNVGLAMAIRHPKVVRRLAINGSHHGKLADAYSPEAYKQIADLPADFAPPLLKDQYDKIAPDPKKWPILVAKAKAMELEFKGYDPKQLRKISSEVLITLGDREGLKVEHAVELYRLLPNARLAVFPKADHHQVFTSPSQVFPTVATFLNETETYKPSAR